MKCQLCNDTGYLHRGFVIQREWVDDYVEWVASLVACSHGVVATAAESLASTLDAAAASGKAPDGTDQHRTGAVVGQGVAVTPSGDALAVRREGSAEHCGHASPCACVNAPEPSDLVASLVERWLPIPGYEGLYEVSSLGRVRGPKGLRKLTPDYKGYLRIALARNGKRQHFRVHHLVLLAFVGPRQEGQQCRHLDGDKTNNRLTNLAWGTNSENQLDRVRHGTHHNAVKSACPQGHPYDTARPEGWRACSECRRAANRASARRMRAPDRGPETAPLGGGPGATDGGAT